MRELERGPAVAGIQLERAAEFVRRLGEAAEPDEIRPPERVVDARVRRIEDGGGADLGDSLLHPPEVKQDASHLAARPDEAWIPVERLPERKERALRVLRRAQVGRLQVVGAPELRPRPRPPGVERGGPLEENDRALESLGALGAEVDDPLCQRLVGLEDLRLVPFRRAGRHGEVEARGQLADDAVLEREEAVHRPVELHGPEDGAGRRLGQPRRNANRAAQPLVAAADDPAGTKLATDLRGDLRARRVASPRQLLEGFVDALARDHGDPFDRLEVGRGRLRDSGSEPVVLAVLRDVLEREDGDRPPRPARGRKRRHGRPFAEGPLDRLELPRHLPHRGRTLGRLLRQHSPHEAVERGRNRAPSGRQRRRLGVADRVDHLDGVRPPERDLPRQHLVKDDAEEKTSLRPSTSRPSACSGDM